MKSFRLQFIDIDSSYTISTTEAPVKGFMVLRSPKGTTEAMYFPYGNEKAINAMIGLPTANWIDIYEAVAFNQEYGLYISAPPGTGVDHPSYYGGVYLTTRGPFDYWQVSDDKDPSYEICMAPGSEPMAWGNDAGTSKLEIDELSKEYSTTSNSSTTTTNIQGRIKISGIDASIFARMNYINLNYWGSDKIDAGVVSYALDGTTTSGDLHYVDPDDGVNKDIKCGIYYLIDGTYTIYIGGNKGVDKIDVGGQDIETATNTANDKVPYISFTKLFNYNGIIHTGDSVSVASDDQNNKINVSNGDFLPFKDNANKVYSGNDAIEKLKNLILDGASSEDSLKSANGDTLATYEAFSGIRSGNRINFRVNIRNITFCRIHQKSPNETPTYVSISNIGYDKWKYDQSVAWIKLEDIKGTDATKAVSKSNISTIEVDSSLSSAIIQGNSDGLVIVDLGPNGTAAKNRLTVYQINTTTSTLADVTATYATQRFYINSWINYNSSSIEKYTVTTNDSSAGADYVGNVYSVYEVVSASAKGIGHHVTAQCTEDSSTYPLKKDINYNTLTISCKEVVIPGEYTSGGEFTGSLSETGVDSYGSNIYWPNILPEETVTFMEVVPEATFDDLNVINDQGFFTGTKIVDPIGPAKDLYTNYLVGQRYCTYVNELNQKDGVLGSAWRDEYYQIVRDGLIEAQDPVYDDALVFMELTGYEDYKPLLMSLRVTYHDTSTIISPKIITKAELANPKTITVSGRSKGVAQYIGEFKKYDTYTGKYYYCQPIGDVGLQLARIMDKKLGGIAPAGTNDSAGLGGCLARNVLAAKWQFNDSALQILDEKGLCAITYDADYGLMIQSQKSTQDPSMVTDWSYLGHSMSFDLCKREIRDKVMTQQLFKRISPNWMEIRTRQVQAILDKRTTGNDPIWATATVDITGQNTPTTMAKRQFVIKVTCKVYVYSETVLLIFENIQQE